MASWTMPGHHHRSGALKQSNKKHKRSKASKRSLARAQGGKVNAQKSSLQRQIQQSKLDRRNRQQQIRQNKREELLRKRRGLDGSSAAPPRVVGIISLGNDIGIEETVRQFITQDADHSMQLHAPEPKASLTVKYDVHKKDGTLTVLTSTTAFAENYGADMKSDSGKAVLAALDLARVSDVLLFIVDGNAPITVDGSDPILDMQIGESDDRSTMTGKTAGKQNWDHLISERGDRILTALKAQGLPTALTVMAQTEKDPLDQEHMTMQSVKSLRRSSIKRHLDLKKYVSRFATTEFGNGNDKVVEVDLSKMHDDEDEMDQDATAGEMTSSTSAARSNPASLVRLLCTMSCSPSKWVAESPRTWLLSDKYTYDQSTEELAISGFLRGIAPFDLNSLVHIPCLGTFAPKSIAKEDIPFKRQHKNRTSDFSMQNEVLEANPDDQESLNRFATPDALAGEQNLIGFDEDEDAGVEMEEDEEPVVRPAGWSDYQSAWLDAVGDDGFDDDLDRGELAEALNRKKTDASVAPNEIDLEEANNISQAERQSLLELRKKEQNEHEEFPDEVQVGEDEEASKRFARYRSLKSFRQSYWDPKENLPDSYASVYHFSSFKATQRSVMNDMKEAMQAANEVQGRFFGKSPPQPKETMEDDSEEDFDPLEGCIPTGSYVTLVLKGVPVEATQLISSKSLLTAVSLLEHENKVSVLHMGLSQSNKMAPSDGVPVKSKDILTFRCGWRTWQARPVFSQNNLNSDKHKFERFLPAGGAFFAASIFGPVTYTPCPVLVWKDVGGDPELIAAGTMMNADADRIVVKRIILTGYPVRVHKRHATVKYMFYNPEDVKWFKPAELYTKHGLRGNIIESVGEHGTMKCLFNAPVKQHDTVCLPLYKRIFPKYATEAEGSSLEIK